MTSSIPRRAAANTGISSNYRSSLIVPAIVFVVCVTIAGLYATLVRNQNYKDYEAGLTQQVSGASSFLDTSTLAYGQLLKSSAAIIYTKPDLTADDWRLFYRHVSDSNSLKAMLGVGYVPVGSRETIESYEFPRAPDGSTITIWPEGEREQYAPILYLQPDIAPNKKAIGHDMFTDDSRRTAMMRARDTGDIAMSAPVLLVQDKDTKNPPMGVLMYYPIYQSEDRLDTIDARRAMLKGFVYVVLRPRDVMSEYAALRLKEYADTSIELTDNDTNEPSNVTMLFSNMPARTSDATMNRFHASETLQIFGRTWQLEISRPESYARRASPIVIFLLGLGLSSMLSLLIYGLYRRRIRAVERAYESEVQRSKDELLALASHQLRTPASGVKQYIGMLAAGLVGDLTPQQQAIADKAYETNERQISIINDLLYVSKLDAGQLVIEPRETNLTSLVQKSIDDHYEQADQKDVKIVYRTKQLYRATVDSRYVSMIIDNLISNALKYSYPASRVIITHHLHNDMYRLDVKDNGVGILPENCERIFTKFTRIDNPLSHTVDGSGLGLFLARQLARAHGGDIVVTSHIGKGSTFSLVLPKELTIDTAIIHLIPGITDD